MVLNLFCFWVYSVWNSWKKVSFHDILKNEQKITKNTKKAQLLKYDCLRSSVFCNETFCVAFKHYVFVDSRYIITLCKEPKSTFSRMRQDPFHLLGKWKKNCIPFRLANSFLCSEHAKMPYLFSKCSFQWHISYSWLPYQLQHKNVGLSFFKVCTVIRKKWEVADDLGLLHWCVWASPDHWLATFLAD